jgi:hypothetical protein
LLAASLFRDKKLPPPTPKGVKGGCSPQNNHQKLRFVCKKTWTPQATPRSPKETHLHFAKKVSNIDASQFAQETPACIGLTLSDLLTLLYRPDTLSAVPNGSASEIRSTPRLSLRGRTSHVDRRLHRHWRFNHFVIAVWRAKEAESAA